MSDLDYLEKARSLAPLIEQHSAEIEAGGSVPAQLASELVSSGLFWILVPTELGGGGQGIHTYIDVIEELSRADGSVGWSVLAASSITGMAAGLLSPEGAKNLFLADKPAILAGQPAGTGRAVRSEGGWTVNGKYQFASGSQFATWFVGGFRVKNDIIDPTAEIVGVYPRDQVQVVPNWDVTGLVGTGSHDYVVSDVSVPEEFTFSRLSASSRFPDAIYKFGLLAVAVAGHAAVVLGLARRALEELAVIVDGKRRVGYEDTVDNTGIFLREFAINDARFHAAGSYLRKAYADAEAMVNEGRPLTAEAAARLRQAATWSHDIAAQVIDFSRLWAGTQSFRNPSTLGRVVRDINVGTQHALIDPVTLVHASGPILEGWRHRS